MEHALARFHEVAVGISELTAHAAALVWRPLASCVSPVARLLGGVWPLGWSISALLFVFLSLLFVLDLGIGFDVVGQGEDFFVVRRHRACFAPLHRMVYRVFHVRESDLACRVGNLVFVLCDEVLSEVFAARCRRGCS